MTELDRPRAVHFVLLNAIAIVLFAKAMATGQGYVDLFMGRTIPHVRYPPLFPALLVSLVASGASIYTSGSSSLDSGCSAELGKGPTEPPTAGAPAAESMLQRLLYHTGERVLGVIAALPDRFREVETGRLARACRVLPSPQASP
jgi:hypothetical protein